MGKTLQELTIADNTHYDVEMQVAKKEALEKRTRYYHSQMDMELLVKGKDYSELPKACVIFICDFDPFEEKKEVPLYLSGKMRRERRSSSWR